MKLFKLFSKPAAVETVHQSGWKKWLLWSVAMFVAGGVVATGLIYYSLSRYTFCWVVIPGEPVQVIADVPDQNNQYRLVVRKESGEICNLTVGEDQQFFLPGEKLILSCGSCGSKFERLAKSVSQTKTAEAVEEEKFDPAAGRVIPIDQHMKKADPEIKKRL